MRTLHVGLRVFDLERSVGFYTHLGYDPTHGRVDPGGLSHLVVQVEDVRATVAQLAVRGVQAEAPGSPDGSADFWTAWVTDPDGYRIELVQWPDGHPDGMTRSDLTGPGNDR